VQRQTPIVNLWTYKGGHGQTWIPTDPHKECFFTELF
jgi:hypothetical protein